MPKPTAPQYVMLGSTLNCQPELVVRARPPPYSGTQMSPSRPGAARIASLPPAASVLNFQNDTPLSVLIMKLPSDGL